MHLGELQTQHRKLKETRFIAQIYFHDKTTNKSKICPRKFYGEKFVGTVSSSD